MKLARYSGFTLIELMVTVAIVGIIAAFALPSFSDLLTKNRLASTSNNFLTDLNFARSEAIKRGSSISICRSNAAHTDCDASGTVTDWANGWLIFLDGTTGTVGAIDAGEMLRVGTPVRAGFTLTASSAFSSFKYFPSGPSSITAGASFTLCKSTQQERVIAISNTGRASITTTATVCS